MKESGKTAAFLTLGCKVNAYETHAMAGLFKAAGYKIVDFKEKADIYIINTCTVTNMADRKSRQMLHRAKKKNPEAVVAAVGCYVQAAGEELLKDGAVDFIIGNNQKHRIVEIVEAGRGKMAVEPVCDIWSETEYERLTIDHAGEKTRAYIKIQDGCNQFCSYCMIPYVRGRVRSRKKQEILDEVAKLAEKGYQEVVLTGIHLSSYGMDLQPAAEGNEAAGFVGLHGRPLLSVIKSLNQMEGLERIRLGSLEPRIITREFLTELSQYEKVCPHFHLSLQSGCNDTLERMNRKYTIEEFRESVKLLRSYFQSPAITTDVIVGFPGETQEEFCQTRNFLEEMSFGAMHIFKYSRRKGTKAAARTDQIAEEVKNTRSDILLALDKELGKQYRRQFFHTWQKVLFEETIEVDGVSYIAGHNERYVKIAVEDTGEASAVCGKIEKVWITGEQRDSVLLGQWAEE